MKTFSILVSYTLVLLSIGSSVQGQYYPDSDVSDESLMRRALYELEARDELNNLITELQIRGLFSKSSSKAKAAAPAAVAPKAVPKTPTQPKIQTPPKAAAAAAAHPEVHHDDHTLSTAPKPKTNNFATPGRTLGGSSTPGSAPKSGEPQMSKSGIAAMKRLEAAKGAAPDAASHASASEANHRVTPLSKTEHSALSAKLDDKRNTEMRASNAAAHDKNMANEAAHKDKGAFGRFKDYASKVRHPSTIEKPAPKTHVDASGNLHTAEKPGKKVNQEAFKSDGITVSGHKEGKWYQKAGNAIAHPLHFVNDRKVDAQKKKLAFDQSLESADKVKFQTDQNEFHKGEADRRKDHRTKQQGDVTAVNANMRFVTAANQVAMLGKTAGVIGRRDLAAMKRRAIVRRWLEEEMDFDLDY